MINLDRFLIIITILLFILGRICDDMGWYSWAGITTNGLQSIALGVLTTTAIITIVRKSCLDQKHEFMKHFIESQVRFIIPWACAVLIIILLFSIFGCQQHLSEQQLSASNYYMDSQGCSLYTVVILVTNFNYSLQCNIHGDLPIIILYEIVLFAQILFNGQLLLRFVGQLTQKSKDYSILYISVFIAWQMLMMDLLFRSAYEAKKLEEKHQYIISIVQEHKQACQIFKKDNNLVTQIRLVEEDINIPQEKQAKQPQQNQQINK